MTRLQAGSATDIGLVRANNQDQMLLASSIFAVADGMGGHAGGEVASQIAVDALRAAFERAEPSAEGVVDAARAANRSVWDAAQAEEDLRGMGTTLTAIALVPSDRGEQLAIVNVGDSRTYHLRDHHLHQVTVDHSYVAELVAEGRIDEAEAEVHPQRHVLTRALGIAPDVDIDLIVRTPVPGDRYLLCSDGLSREVNDAQVASTLQRQADPGDAARALVAAAKGNGGSDNITVVVVDIVADDPTTEVLPAVEAGAPQGSKAAAVVAPVPVAPDAPQESPVVPADDGGEAARTAGPDAAAADPEGESPATDATRAGRGARRRAAKADGVARARVVTVRVIAFFVLLVAILVVAALGTGYYARSTYYVGLSGSRITIFQGRPGGVLWWKPTVSQRTALTTASVLSYNLPALRAGVQESSLDGARAYVTNLHVQKVQSTPTTTAPPATTIPTTTTVPPRHTRHHHHRSTTSTTARA